MPPKRGQRSSATAPAKRRKTTRTDALPSTATLPTHVDISPVGPPTQDSTIDYDKLALAILKHSAQIPQEHGSLSAENLSGSQTVSQTSDILQTVVPQPPSVPGPSSSQTASSTTNPSPVLGELLDRVFSGEPARATELPYSATIVSDGIPLGSSVSLKLKLKIWNHEFIDFRSLQSAREEPLSVSIATGVIQLHQSPKFESPITISQWTDAFLLFVAVYIEKYPSEAPYLLKYGHMIREIQQLHGDNAFRSYDEQFRKLKESVNVPWQQPIQELRLKAATLSKTFPMKPTQNQNQPFRVRHCFQYNRGERCNKNPCPFWHNCMQCRGYHPKVKCTDASKPHWQQSKAPNTNQNKKST